VRRLVLVLTLLLPSRVFAQGSVVLTVTGGPVTVPAPAVADYNAGFVLDPAALSYSVAISGGPPTMLRSTTVSIRATSGSFGTLPVGDLQWERSDLTTWNSLTTTDVQVEARTGLQRTLGNTNWSNSVHFRCLIAWTNTPPATYSTNIIVTLTVTSP